MKNLIVYDNQGYVIFQGSEGVREPVGVPFLWVDVPLGKRIKLTDGIGVDISVTPHQAILEDIPPTEIELVRLEMARGNAELFETIIMMSGGGA